MNGHIPGYVFKYFITGLGKSPQRLENQKCSFYEYIFIHIYNALSIQTAIILSHLLTRTTTFYRYIPGSILMYIITIPGKPPERLKNEKNPSQNQFSPHFYCFYNSNQ